MVVGAGVPPDGSGIVPLDVRTVELVCSCPDQVRPVTGDRLHLGRLVNMDSVPQAVTGDASQLQEPEEKHDQTGVAIDEIHLLGGAVRLAFRAFAPVGDGAGDKDLAVG